MPLIVTDTCVVDDIAVVGPAEAVAGEPFIVRADAVGDAHPGRSPSVSCPVRLGLATSSEAVVVSGPTPDDVVDLAVSGGEWSVTAAAAERIVLNVGVTSTERCTRRCGSPATRPLAIAVDPNRAVAELRRVMATTLSDATVTARQGSKAREGTPSRVTITVAWPPDADFADVAELDVTLSPTAIPDGSGTANQTVESPATMPAALTYEAIVTPPTDKSFDALVNVTIRAAAGGLPVEQASAKVVRINVRSDNRVLAFLQDNGSWVIPVLGVGTGGGLLAALRWLRSRSAPRPQKRQGRASAQLSRGDPARSTAV